MRLVVADTSPIRYLVRIGKIDLLPHLFEKIFLPSVVADELRHPSRTGCGTGLDATAARLVGGVAGGRTSTIPR